jgi:uncharacterized protein (DUF1778 family)
MPPKKKAKRLSRSAFVQIRLSTEDKKRFERAAELDRRTLSDFARVAMEDRSIGLEKAHGPGDPAKKD